MKKRYNVYIDKDDLAWLKSLATHDFKAANHIQRAITLYRAHYQREDTKKIYEPRTTGAK